MSEAIQAASRFFLEAMAFLRAGYPAYRPTDQEWIAVVRRYEAEFGRFPQDVLRAAFRRSSTAYRDWFPSLGQLRELVEAENRGWLTRQAQPSSQAVALLPEGSPLSEDNPFEQLARRFEREPSDPEAKAAELRELAEKLGPGSLA